jgi:hypothetical protein
LLLLIGVLAPLTAAAQSVPLASLRGIALAYENAIVVQARPGPEQLLRLDTLPGDRLILRLPFVPNRLEPLVADGAEVAPGQALARVSGPELNGWLLRAQATQTQFRAAEQRYRRNLPLYEQQALSADSWLSISDRYQRLRLEQHHVEHVLEWLRPGDGEGQPATLHAPRAGILLFAGDGSAGEGGEIVVAELIDRAALRFSARLPAGSDDRPVSLESDGCRLAVVREEQHVSGFSRQVWSEPLGDCAPARPGLLRGGRVFYAFDGFAVPRSAVLRDAGRTVVALRRGDALQLSDVAIHGEDASSYYVTAGAELADYPLLTRSASALQGLLLGLGDE